MNFVVVSPGMPHDGNTLKERSLGGSETAAIQLAEAIAARKDPFGGKCRVTVFSPCEKPVMVNGVHYVPIQAAKELIAGADVDVLITSRMVEVLMEPNVAKVNYLWCHDLVLGRAADAFRGVLYQTDRVLLMSQFQSKQYQEVTGIQEESIEVIRNGIDLGLFSAPRSVPREEGLMVYAARPERGLENLVMPGGIMEKLAQAGAPVKLAVAFYDNTVPEMRAFYDMLWARCRALPNVEIVGSLTKKQLYDLYSRAWLYVYPTPGTASPNFAEISCLAGDTLIDIPRDYRANPNGVPICELVGKSNFPAYCYDNENGRMTLGTVKWVAKTKTDAEVWRLTLDDGSVVRATPEHEIMLRDGTYRPLRDLKPGDSLMPLYKHHRVVVNRNDGTWVDEARLVGEWMAGRPLDGHNEHVHHRLDWWSNAPENLQVLSRAEHFSKTHKGKKRHRIERAKQRESMLSRLARMTEEERKTYFVSRPKAVRAMWDKVRTMSPDEQTEWLSNRAAKANRQTDKYRSACATKGAAVISSLWERINSLPPEERQEWLDRRTEKMAVGRWNHTVVDVRPDGFEDVYDMEVDTHHNFVANGIVVHNCITAMEVAACGLPILTNPVGALPETVKKGCGVIVQGTGTDPGNGDVFVREIFRLAKDPLTWKRMSKACYDHALDLSWDPVAERLIELSDEIMREKSADRTALYKHFYKLSEIDGCRRIEADGPIEMCEKVQAKIKEGWAFTESPEAYREHYKKVDAGASVAHYETSENEPRLQVLQNFLRQNPGRYKRVLDYGCWIGHQAIRIANEFPEMQVLGIDVTPRNIELAEECRKKYAKNGNIEFHVYDEMSPDDGEEGLGKWRPAGSLFDLVLCNEVLEHVLDPDLLIHRLEMFCSENGTIFLTTPSGPWEAMSYDTFPHRCHLRHYEQADLDDIFGEKESPQIFWKSVTKDDSDRALGHHYVTYTRKEGKPTGAINWERKMAYQAPRQTLSVCMIVKDAEEMLGRVLRSVSGIADEIIIADTGSTDHTKEIAARYGAIVLDGPNPLDPNVEGFEEARNFSIQRARGSWILWIDDDEELLQPEKLEKYLRMNPMNGYGVAQHHLSVDPPMALKPDLPIRLFRNGMGIRFFGIVHEHPERELNKGVGNGITLADTWIAHDGYLTEAIRKGRFLRNIDLVFRDRKKYPERILGYFLLLRDLIHLTRYHLQMSNGQGPSPQVLAWAKEAQELFESRYLNNPGDPMVPDALMYYSEANRILGKGLPVRLKFQIANMPEKEISGQFSNSEKMAGFVSGVLKGIGGHFEGRWF